MHATCIFKVVQQRIASWQCLVAHEPFLSALVVDGTCGALVLNRDQHPAQLNVVCGHVHFSACAQNTAWCVSTGACVAQASFPVGGPIATVVVNAYHSTVTVLFAAFLALRGLWCKTC